MYGGLDPVHGGCTQSVCPSWVSRGGGAFLHPHTCTSDRVHIRILYLGSRDWLLGGSHPQARLKEGQPAPVSATAISQWAQELLAALWEAPISSGSGTPHQLQQQLSAPIPPLGPADVETLARRGLLLSRLLLLFADVTGMVAAVLKQVCMGGGGWSVQGTGRREGNRHCFERR